MNKKILIIEDDREMCGELQEILTDLDYGVHAAFDGLTGKKLFEKNAYDFVILDLKIPGFNGYQMLDFIRKKKTASRIIVITARMKIHFEDIINPEQEKSEEELMKTASYVLKKPFKIADLIDALKKMNS